MRSSGSDTDVFETEDLACGSGEKTIFSVLVGDSTADSYSLDSVDEAQDALSRFFGFSLVSWSDWSRPLMYDFSFTGRPDRYSRIPVPPSCKCKLLCSALKPNRSSEGKIERVRKDGRIFFPEGGYALILLLPLATKRLSTATIPLGTRQQTGDDQASSSLRDLVAKTSFTNLLLNAFLQL